MDQSSKYRLRCKAIESLHELDRWWREWIIHSPEACERADTDPKTTMTADATGPLYLTVLRYSDLWAGYMVCTHHCIRILLLYILQQLSVTSQEFWISSEEDQFRSRPCWVSRRTFKDWHVKSFVHSITAMSNLADSWHVLHRMHLRPGGRVIELERERNRMAVVCEARELASVIYIASSSP